MPSVPNQYDVGDLIRCTGIFTDLDGDALDPTVVIFKFKDPSDNETTYTYGVDAELVKSTIGNYYVDVDADEAGDFWYRFHSTGTGQAAGEERFRIRTSQF
jgi:hypothetical protein